VGRQNIEETCPVVNKSLKFASGAEKLVKILEKYEEEYRHSLGTRISWLFKINFMIG